MSRPAASTVAGRQRTTTRARSNGAPKPRAASVARAARHAPSVKRSATPRAPRRVSGPLGGRAVAAAQAALARPATLPAPSLPRRRPVAVPRPARQGTLGTRAILWLRDLPDHRMVDRMVRGRTWIVVLGVLLAGLVALQVTMLKLNAGIGRDVEKIATLQRENQLAKANVSRLSDGDRIETMAAQMGLVFASPDAVGFATHRRGDAAAAVARLQSGGIASGSTTPSTVTATPSTSSQSSVTPPASSTTTTPLTAGTDQGSAASGTSSASPSSAGAATATGTTAAAATTTTPAGQG